MSFIYIRQTLFSALLLFGATIGQAQNFDLIPLYGIKVNSEKLTYSNIVLQTSDASAVVRTDIPQNQEFSIVVQNPDGFNDSAGWILYGMEFTLLRETGEVVAHTADIFKGTALAIDTTLKSVNLTNTFNTETKPGTKLIIKGRLFDRNGAGFIAFQYDFTVVAASKRLPAKVFTYHQSDSRGMRTASVGLHFNFFEFKGIEGNNFLYKVKRGAEIKVLLRGLDGWKVTEGRVAPRVDIELLDVDGKPVEKAEDILAKSLGETMSEDKKELAITFEPEIKLPSEQFYYAWIKISDRSTKKSAMDVVVKFYVED